MKSLLKMGVFFGLFLVIAGAVAYLTVRLIVRSEDVVVVPDLLGRDAVYALEILTDLGLNIRVSAFEYRGDIPKNHVAYQEPGPGAVVKKDRPVRIVLSKGPQNVVVPNLVGMDVREANIIMEENGLTRGVISESHSREALRGELLAQDPGPGEIVKRGEAIDLLVSMGKQPVRYKMPYLHGLTVEDAIIILEKSHLNLGHIRSVRRNDLPKGVVIDQVPPSGYPTAPGHLVDLKLNRWDDRRLPDKGFRLFHYRVRDGWLKRHVRLRISAFGVLYDLYDTFEPPGEEIWVLIPGDPDFTYFFYEDGELISSHSFPPGSERSGFRQL
jgi:serine/threonine-protein kinase